MWKFFGRTFLRMRKPMLFTILANVAILSLAADMQPSPVFYVAPNGSDMASGRSLENAFKTPQRAIQAIRETDGGTVRLAGLYKLRQPLRLPVTGGKQFWTSVDSGGAVFDGGNQAKFALRVQSDRVTISGFKIKNFIDDGIVISAGDEVVISNNFISNIAGPSWNSAAIAVVNDAKRVNITGNHVNNTGYIGIGVFGRAGTSIGPSIISGNTLYNVCQKTKDCGGIHLLGRVKSTDGSVVSNNIIDGYGSVQNKSVGIYLDDFTSKAKVYGNRIFGDGLYSIIIHGGDNNIIYDNEIHISNDSPAIYYVSLCCFRKADMSGNEISNNKVEWQKKKGELIRIVGSGVKPKLYANSTDVH